jgi:hypothetical protein
MEWRDRIFPAGARTPPWAHRRPTLFLSLGSNQNGLISWCFRPCTMGVLREGAYQNKPSVLLSTGAYLYRRCA